MFKGVAFCARFKLSVSWSCFMFGEMIEEVMIITACGNYVTADDETRPVSLVSRSLPERKQFSTYQLVRCMDGGPMPLADTPPSPPTSRAGHKAHWTRGNSGQDDAVLGVGIVDFLVHTGLPIACWSFKEIIKENDTALSGLARSSRPPRDVQDAR